MEEDKRVENAMRWQARVLAGMRRRMPGFLVQETIPMSVEVLSPGRLGSFQGRSLSHPQGLIRLQEDHYARGEKACADTLKHELVHAHVDLLGIREDPHGPVFRKLAVFFGLHSFGAYSWRWRFECAPCRRWVKTNEPAKRHCRSCWRPMKRRDFVKLTKEERKRLLEGETNPMRRVHSVI